MADSQERRHDCYAMVGFCCCCCFSFCFFQAVKGGPIWQGIINEGRPDGWEIQTEMGWGKTQANYGVLAWSFAPSTRIVGLLPCPKLVRVYWDRHPESSQKVSFSAQLHSTRVGGILSRPYSVQETVPCGSVVHNVTLTLKSIHWVFCGMCRAVPSSPAVEISPDSEPIIRQTHF